MTAAMMLLIAGSFLALGRYSAVLDRRRAEAARDEMREIDEAFRAYRQTPTQVVSRPASPRLTDLPEQFGTLAEHRRRVPMRIGEVTDDGLREITVRPAIPVAEAHEAPGWPLHWWPVWVALLPVHYLLGARHFWDTSLGVKVDRFAVWLGRFEHRYVYDLPASPEQLRIAETLSRLAHHDVDDGSLPVLYEVAKDWHVAELDELVEVRL